MNNEDVIKSGFYHFLPSKVIYVPRCDVTNEGTPVRTIECFKVEPIIKKVRQSQVLDSINRLRVLKDNWYWDEQGTAYQAADLDWLQDQMIVHDWLDNHVFPMVDPPNMVKIEWTIGRWAVDIEINLTTHTAEWLDFNLAESILTSKTFEKELNLDLPEDWQWAENRVNQLKLRSDTASPMNQGTE